MISDELLQPYAQTGSTFHDPAPARAPIAEYALPWRACLLIVLATVAVCGVLA